MQVATDSRYGETYPTHMPKLSYRRPASNDTPSSPITSSVVTTTLTRPDAPSPRSLQSPGPMIRDIRAAIPQEIMQAASAQQSSSFSPTPPQKKRASIFGGLFTKEPTLVALAQVEADLRAKHGSVTAQAVPHVSSTKMPSHVPKVNSAWDGIPYTIKEKERQSRDRERPYKRNSALPPSTGHSRGSDPMAPFRDDPLYMERHRQDSGSDAHAKSWDNESSEYRRSETYPRSYRSRSACSDDSDRYGPPRDRPASTWSQSLRSPSGTSLPEITSFFPKKTASKPPQPQRYQSSSSSNTRSTASSGNVRYENGHYADYRAPSVDAIPEYSSSPLATPRETSPVTPSYLSEKERERFDALAIDTVLDSAGHSVKSPRTSVTDKAKGRPGVFLAGEARPMEVPTNEDNDEQNRSKRHELPSHLHTNVARVQNDMGSRPRSSRKRLGLGGSMIVREDAAPWEVQDPSMSATSSRMDNSKSKKRSSKAFGGLGK